MAELTCPACGAGMAPHFRHAKLISCEYCESLVFLEDGAASSAGSKSTMTEWPTLLELGGRFEHKGWRFVPVGHLRFEYQHGFWDEWWVLGLHKDEGRWISVDEGDYAVEEPVDIDSLPAFESLSVGASCRVRGESLRVTETGHARCTGVRGELPEVIELGDEFDFAHLSGADGRLITVEWQRNGVSATAGRWIDPFELYAL